MVSFAVPLFLLLKQNVHLQKTTSNKRGDRGLRRWRLSLQVAQSWGLLRGWQGLGGARTVQAPHTSGSDPAQGHRPAWGRAGSLRTQRPSPPSTRTLLGWDWGRRETAELRIATRKLGSPEAFPESLRVLRSETESGPRAPRQGNEGFSKNKSENTNPHHSRITYAVSFNIILWQTASLFQDEW